MVLTKPKPKNFTHHSHSLKTHKNSQEPRPKYFPKKESIPPDSRKSALRAVMGHELNPRPGPTPNECPSIL
jgi:hypothetical protein